MKLHLPARLRKAIIAALATVSSFTFASGTSWADSYNLLESGDNWTMSAGQDAGNRTPRYNAATDETAANISTTNWGQALAVYGTGDQVFTVGDDGTLSFSATLQSGSPGNSIASVSLTGSNQTLVIGTFGYNTSNIAYGITSNTSADIYATDSTTWNSGVVYQLSTAEGASDTVANIGTRTGNAFTLSGVVTCGEDGNYTLDLSLDGTEVATDVSLGSYFDISRITLQADGGNNVLSALTIDGILGEIPAVTIVSNGADDQNLVNTPLSSRLILNLSPDDGNTNDFLCKGSGGVANIGNAVEIQSCVITNGFSSTTYNFTGKITGSGEFKQKDAGTYNNQSYVFSGDMSQYSGNMTLENGNNSVLKFADNISGTGTITISGANDKIVVAGATMKNSAISATNMEVSGASVFDGTVTISSLLTLGADTLITNNGSFTFADGARIDLSNATYEEDAIGNKIYTLFAGDGTTNLETLTIANIVSPDMAASYTFDGTTITMGFSSSLLTFDGGTLLWNTDETNTAFAGENGDAVAFSSGDAVTFAGDSMVTLGANVAMSTLTVNADANVSVAGANHSISSNVITVNGTLSVSEASDMIVTDLAVNGTFNWESAADISIAGALTVAADATFKYEGATTLNPATIAVNGTLNITGNNVDISKNITGSGKLEVSEGGILSLSGNAQQIKLTTVNIGADSTLKTLRTDAFRWNDATVVTIEEGGKLDCGNQRQTTGAVAFVLNGATITGVGGENGGDVCALDYHQSNTITVNDDSTISANIRVQNGKTLTLKVADGKTLTMSGVTVKAGKLVLNAVEEGGAAGTMLVKAANTYTGGTDINSGTVELHEAGTLGTGPVTMAANTKLKINNASATTHAGAITGDASTEIIKTGSAAVTLSGVTNFGGLVRITEGSLGFSQAVTLGQLVTDGGSLHVDGALQTAPVITLSTAPADVISLFVTNAGSIGASGMRIFAEGSPIPTNVLVDSLISVDDNGAEWTAAYNNGVLTKTRVEEASAGAFTWIVSKDNNRWGAITATTWNNGTGEQRWVDGSTVTFAGEGEAITLVSAVVVGAAETTTPSAIVTGTNYEWLLGDSTKKLTIHGGVNVAENASLALTGVSTSNYDGVVTGAGSLELKSMGDKSTADLAFVLSSAAEGGTINKVVLSGDSALKWESSNEVNSARMNNITHLVVEDGARLDHKVAYNSSNAASVMTGEGRTLTISGSGCSTGTAAALTFGDFGGASGEFRIARQVTMAGDATIYARTGTTGVLTGGFDAAGHALSLIGGGSLKIHAPKLEVSALSIADGMALNLFRDGTNNPNPTAANEKHLLGDVTVGNGATLIGENHASRIEISNLSGTGTFNMQFKHDFSVVSSTIVGGAADFEGTINLSHTHNSARSAIFATADHDALSNAVINIGSIAHANSKLGFVLANDGSESIQIAGINTAEGVAVGQAVIVSQDGVSIASDGDMRTLEIVGSGTNSFGGTVLAGVNLVMNGSGSQSFNGNLDAFNGTIEVKNGTLNMASMGSASAITLAGKGSTLGVTTGVSGASLSVDATGAVLSADLTAAGASITLGATSAWSVEGGLSLDSHKLVLDSNNKGSLAVNLEDVSEGSIVELFTGVSSLENAAGEALVLTAVSNVGQYFDTGSDTDLANYLLNWDEASGTLSLMMKGEVADLLWDDADDNNEWKSASTHTNWYDAAQDAESRFSLGDNVTFAGSGEEVSIVGTVSPFNVTISSGDYTWTGEGAVNASGKLNVSSGATLTISNSGAKNFTGGVELADGSVLTLTNASGWSGTVSGAGSLVVATGQAVESLGAFVNANATNQLGTLSISGEGTSLSVNNADAALLQKVDTLEITNKAVLNVTEDASLDCGSALKLNDAAVEVAAEKQLAVSSAVQLAGTVTKNGEGTWTLTSGATGSSNSTVISAGTIKIDGTAEDGYALGNVSGAGTLLLSNGSVKLASLASETTLKVATEEMGDCVEVSGIDGSALSSVTLVEGSQLTGVNGDITVGEGATSLSLALGAANVGASATIVEGKQAMIAQTGNLVVGEGATLTLGIDAITALLTQASLDSERVYLHLTTGSLQMVDTSAFDLQTGNTSADLLMQFGVRLTGVEQGSLVLAGGALGIYAVADDTIISKHKELAAYQSTVVASGKTLELQLDGPYEDGTTVVLNNLLGGTDSALLISNSNADETLQVELVNKYQDISLSDEEKENLDESTIGAAAGADTEFAGNIDATSGIGNVEVIISGPGTLTVGGSLDAAQLTMNEGGLILRGKDSTIGSLADDGISAEATSADATLTVGGGLVVENASSLRGTTVAGDGTLSLKDTLELSESASLNGVAINLVKNNFNADGALALKGITDAEVSALNGQGALKGTDAVLTVVGDGGSFSGSFAELDSSTPTKNLLKIAKGASQTLDRASGSSVWSVENDGNLTINLTNPNASAGTGTNKVLTLDTLTLRNGSSTTLVINTDAPGAYMNLQELVVENGAIVQLESTGIDEIDFGGSITLAQAVNGVTLGDDVTVELDDSAAFKKVREAVLTTDGKVLTLETAYHTDNQYAQMATTGNAMAGATLLWSVNTGSLGSDSSLKIVDEVVHSLYNQGTSAAAAQADEIMAAVAGSSTAILGSALASDVERQLRAIRNRTTSMGVGQCEVNEGMPYFNAWINAEGDHHELDADGTNAGYTRDSWGGTVGFDADLNPYVTVGMAVTAMYGDIDSDAADKAEGDFDSQYVSLFARYARNAWTHTFVMTVGKADMTLNRTVNYGSGQYETEGETEGTAFGFMYEVGRVYALTEDGGVCLQPMFNVNLRHSTIDSYTETGCDAALAVGEQSFTTVTFGVGARVQAVIGTSIYNRASIFEARVLAKLDAGDRESEADVRLLQGGDTSSVKSAELGAFGAEVGMGITIPMGADAGSIFIDGSAELRSGYTNINGTVGYRVNF